MLSISLSLSQFLSMKLSSVNTRMDLSIESLVSKDVSSMVHFFSTNFVAF